ncbi:MAG TPA: potassium channel family protein [Acidimicrobiales bacterium]|nr:potassium channel family protein [Acidimicrobiales bacterium]
MPRATDEATESEREARALRRFLRSFRSTDSYGLVLLMIIATYVLAVALPARWGASIVLVVQIATVRLSLHTSRARRGFLVVANGVFAIAAVAAVANLFSERAVLTSFVFVSASALYVVAPISIVRHIGYRHQVDQETMLGALAAYLLIGMAFAFMYRFIGSVQGGPFFGAGGEGTISDDLFFSFVTLTTTGYGNLVPAKNPGQSLAVLEALTGQLFLVTAVAKVVTAWRPRGWRDTSAGAEATPEALPEE